MACRISLQILQVTAKGARLAKSEIRNPKSEIRNPNSEIRNPKFLGPSTSAPGLPDVVLPEPRVEGAHGYSEELGGALAMAAALLESFEDRQPFAFGE